MEEVLSLTDRVSRLEGRIMELEQELQRLTRTRAEQPVEVRQSGDVFSRRAKSSLDRFLAEMSDD